MLSDVRQRTIEPVITGAIAAGSLVHTDEYVVYARLPAWGYRHKTVCHGRGEYARDEDGDGFCEVHVNTIEGFWSLLRSWLRPHRGISQDKLPLYLGFFQFVHNARRRGKALLGALVAAFRMPQTQHPGTQQEPSRIPKSRTLRIEPGRGRPPMPWRSTAETGSQDQDLVLSRRSIGAMSSDRGRTVNAWRALRNQVRKRVPWR